MSDKPISPLRQRMIDDMRARRFSEDTQRDYVRNVRNFAAFLGQSPDTATKDAVSDEAGRAFQKEGGHRFRFEAGRDSDLMSATRRLLPRISAMMFCPEPLVKRGLDFDLRKSSGGGG